MIRTYNSEKSKASHAAGDDGLVNPNPINIVVPPYLADKIIFDGLVRDGNVDKRMIVFCTEFGRETLAEFH